ncbi:hypothetical protein HY416_02885 [Candidatus Kaiserbacteria bacterium]|nr:hypothetical protein [Candidatus Kaiserbacteria bacterium]
MKTEGVIAILEQTGAIVTGSHFVYTNKEHGEERHGETYIDVRTLHTLVEETSLLYDEIAQRFLTDDVEAVVAPETAGIITGHVIASHLSFSSSTKVVEVTARKETVRIPDPEGRGRRCYAETGGFAFRHRDARLLAGRRVLVVDGVLNTGGSILKVVRLLEGLGCTIVGVGVIWNRRGAILLPTTFLGVPKFFALVNQGIREWTASQCALTGPCAWGRPINKELGQGT